MYGPVATAPPPRRGARVWRVLLRVLLTAVPVLSIGMLSWVSMLYLALVHRRVRDWLVFVAVAAASIGGLVLVGPSGKDGWQVTTGVVLLLAAMVFAPAYFLAVDLRLRPSGGPAPAPGHPYAGHPYPGHPPYAGHPPYPGHPYAGPPPQDRVGQDRVGQDRVGQDRIGQVKDGLDELSAYLERQERP
ncbi:hypothetical protein [Kitasatospora sp. NPDC101183]|uniref:hypothetical protein n=1 Tax=Kitasatospora sp. NPDC101183 TaxID=3364100 RepID=UPI003827E192